MFGSALLELLGSVTRGFFRPDHRKLETCKCTLHSKVPCPIQYVQHSTVHNSRVSYTRCYHESAEAVG